MSDDPGPDESAREEPATVNEVCPVCGGPLEHQKCKVVCRSDRCVYRIIYNCAEF